MKTLFSAPTPPISASEADTTTYSDIQDQTHPVPFGFGSILSELRNDSVKAADAILYIAVNYCSNWQSSNSHFLSQKRIADMLGLPQRYVRKILKRMSRYLKKLKTTRKGSRYQVAKHVYDADLIDASDIPVDENGRPLTFAVPHGYGSPIGRMFRGELSWQACLVWIVLRFNSDWRTGLSNATSMLKLASMCRLGAQTICEAIKELEKLGLVVRQTKLNEEAIYQIFPKPKDKNKAGSEKDDKQGTETATHWYSDNFQYRCSRKDTSIEKRISKKRWKRVRDSELHCIPLPISDFFEARINCERIRQSLLTS